jgi:hypothetical protein
LTDVRSVVKAANSWTFDSRGVVAIELKKIHEKARALPAGIPAGKRAEAQLLNLAFEKDAEEDLVGLELRSRGYSRDVEYEAMERAPMSESLSRSQHVLLGMVRRELPAAEFRKLKQECDAGFCDVSDEAAKREPWVNAIVESWQ